MGENQLGYSVRKLTTGLLRAYTYELDKVGNRLQTVEQYTQGQIRAIVRDYEYDDLYRLTRAVEQYDGPPPEVIETSYSYDLAGNRLNMTTNRPEQGPPGAPVTTVYSYNEANWLLTETTNNKTTTYGYDGNGNRMQVTRAGSPKNVVETYQYDFENRLIEYERTGDGAVRRAYLEYDGLGRRFAKGTQQGGGTVFWTQYAYRQLSMDPLAEYPQTGPPRETYLYRGRAGTLIGMEEQQGGGAGKEYWFSQDGLGNIATVTKHSGQSAHDYFYDPYGNIIDNNGKPEDSSNWTDPHNHYLLNGKEWDEEMRLHYFGARYYDSAAGVWLTQDIYRGEIEQPLSLHRTLYVLANPVNRVDAYGYRAEIIPNGYMDAGGGTAPVRTERPAPPNSTTQDNPPVHVEDLYTLRGDWSEAEEATIQQTILDMGRAYQSVINDFVYRTNELLDRFGAEIEVFARQAYVTASQAFQQVHGGRVTLRRSDQTCQEAWQASCLAKATGAREITFYQKERQSMVWNPETGERELEMREIINEAGETEWVPVMIREDVNIAGNTRLLIHELGHTFEGRVNVRLRTRPGETPVRDTLRDDTTILRRIPENTIGDDRHYGFAGPFPVWQHSEQATTGEEFADMMIGWVYGRWAMEDGVLTPQGEARSDFMQRHMPEWVLVAAGYISGG
jgi:RHS repeat-associated protein